MSKEDFLTQMTQRALDYIQGGEAGEESGWKWELDVFGRCRVESPNNVGGYMIRQDIITGKKKCPYEGGYLGTILSPNPGGNIAEAVAVMKFPEECEVCRRKPTISDFELES